MIGIENNRNQKGRDKMAKNLVIVESPHKTGPIGDYLGKDFKVVASKGHIRDLSTNLVLVWM